MTGKLFLTAFAAVAAVAVVASPQDPSFEFPAAKHVGFNIQNPVVVDQDGDQLSVTFKSASWGEVFDWLKDHGVNFVLGENEINKELRVNIHVVNVSKDALMGALAGALDGHWDKKNDIWVFRKGRSWIEGAPTMASGKGDTFFAPTAPARTEVFGTTTTAPPAWTKAEKAVDAPFAIAQGKAFTTPAPMNKEQMELFKKAMGKMNDPKAWEEFQKSWEKWSKDYEKNYKEFEKNFKGYEFDGKAFKGLTDGSTVFVQPGQATAKVDQKMVEDMVKRATEVSKTADGKAFVLRGKDGEYKVNQKAIDDIQKRALEFSKTAEGNRVFLQPGKDGFTYRTAPAKPMTAKQLKEFKTANGFDTFKGLTLSKGDSIFAGPRGSAGTSLKNIKAIYDLMTPAQEMKVKRSGYLNYSDLNSKQRALLGVIGEDSWSVTYKTDKWGLTIKSDH